MKTLISLPQTPKMRQFMTDENVALAQSFGEVIFNNSEKSMTEDELAERIIGCDIYVTIWGSPMLTEKVLKNADSLKLLVHLGGTVVPFVSEAMWQRGIRVISANDYFAKSTAEGTLAYMLSALRDIPYYSQLAKSGGWKPQAYNYYGLFGKKIGLVSYGSVARHLVRMLAPFEPKLSVYDIRELPKEDVERYGITQCSLNEVFSNNDIISVHTPLNEKTYHLIGAEQFSLIPEGSLFLNTSRGPVLDEKALEKELAKGRFRAVLDVYENEPPKEDCKFYSLPNVMMLPHMGGTTTDMYALLTHDLLLEAYNFIEKGEPLKNEISRSVALSMSRS